MLIIVSKKTKKKWYATNSLIYDSNKIYRPNQGLEAIEIPTFLANFISMGKSVIDLQQNFKKYRNLKEFIGTLMKNSS